MCQNTGKIIQICILCGKSSTDRGNMRKHVENIHFPGTFTYPCNVCNKVFNTRNNLNHHKSKYHRTDSVVLK